MEAKIPTELISQFDGKISQGAWKKIIRFKVIPASGSKKTSDMAFGIVFLPSTCVDSLPPQDDHLGIYQTNFNDILAGWADPEKLVGKFSHSTSYPDLRITLII